MPLSTLTKPDHTTQTGSAYKVAIDNMASDVADSLVPSAVIANHTRAGYFQIPNGGSSSKGSFDIEDLTINTWEMVGPTGSPGIDHTWFVLDQLPLSAGILLGTIYLDMYSTALGAARFVAYAKHTSISDAQTANNQANMIAFHNLDQNESIPNSYVLTQQVMVPLDANNNFDLRYTLVAGTTLTSALFHYNGFIDNGS